MLKPLLLIFPPMAERDDLVFLLYIDRIYIPCIYKGNTTERLQVVGAYRH